MSTYIHFTDEQKQRAASVDLEEFLRCRGEKLLTSGREKRLARDHSVTIRGNEWYDHAEERGGHAVSFVQRFYHLSYPEAVTMLLGGELGTIYPSAQERWRSRRNPLSFRRPIPICAGSMPIWSSTGISTGALCLTSPERRFCMKMPSTTTQSSWG